MYRDECAKELACALFRALSSENITHETLLLMQEWEVLFHLSENDQGQSDDVRKRRNALTSIFDANIDNSSKEYQAIYALHTTYAIIVKMIAVKAFSDSYGELETYSSENLQRFLYEISNGNVTLMGIRNLIEEDFFSWYCTPKQWNEEIYQAIIKVVREIGEPSPDILRELYMEVMPNAVRHSLGEYYTPAWLADHVVEKSMESLADNWRAVDPCCGSGVFLTRLIEKICSEYDMDKMTKEDRIQLIDHILHRVIGIDLNPISVLTARVTYALSILPLLKDTNHQITIPVYLGDSANPSEISVAQIKDINLIIGNPPWVKCEQLPKKYAEKLKNQCIEKHLFSGQTYMGAVQLNICALIAAVTASQWLADDGKLVFLMPKTLLTQDSYAGFRNFYLDYETGSRMYLEEIDDWSKARHPFIYTREDFATYFYSKNVVDYKHGVPVTFYKKKRGKLIEEINEYSTWDEVRNYFSVTKGTAVQLGEDRTGFTIMEGNAGDEALTNVIGECAYIARSGVEFTPSEVYWLRYHQTLSDGENAVFENIDLPRARYKAVTTGETFSLETNYIFPLVFGPSICKYGYDYKGEYCIFPYYYENGVCKFVNPEKMLDESEKLYHYFNKNRDVIGAQSEKSIAMKRGSRKKEMKDVADEFYALSKVGPYTFSGVSVAFRDNTCMSAVVLKPQETEWGEVKQFVCAKHAAYVSVDKYGNYISEDEAYYIAAILNTRVVERYFETTYSKRSYSIKNLNVYIPKYDASNSIHAELTSLSRKAHGALDSKELKDVTDRIEMLYREMCGNKYIELTVQ